MGLRCQLFISMNRLFIPLIALFLFACKEDPKMLFHISDDDFAEIYRTTILRFFVT